MILNEENPNKAKIGVKLYTNEIALLTTKYDGEILPQATEKAKAIKKALNEQFDSIITEADWENVDLLIFYLNTGRADSLKEALLLVDRQRQTDQIVDAINSAAVYISNSIASSTYRLATAMGRCFERLSVQIAQNHKEMLDGMERLNSNFGSISSGIRSLESQVEAQGKSIVDAEKLNSALLERANLNSQELMYELRYNQSYWNL